MRRWSELAERVAGTTRTSEKTALLADYLRSLSPAELPIATVFLTGRPFPESDQRAPERAWRGLRSVVRPRHGGGGRARGRGTYTRPGDRTDAARGRRHVLGDRGRVRSGPQERPPRVAARTLRPADREVRRQDPVRRAPDRAPRWARGG